jgi:hypothetical protein
MKMQDLLRLEEAAIFVGVVLAFYGSFLGPEWLAVLLLFAPDLSAVGYLAGPRVGAFTYNLAHHRGLAVALYFAGISTETQWLIWAGIFMFAHSTLDRVLGYGLKYPDSFQNTHLGPIGRSKR